MNEKAVCQNPRCGRTYVKNRGNQKYCGENCRIQATINRTHKGKLCRWCEERFKITFKTRHRSYCFKQECIQREWYYHFLSKYGRCKACHGIIPHGKRRNAWGNYYFCAFDTGSVKREIREAYVKWLKNLPRYVSALLPNPTPKHKNLKQYVKSYDINNLKFQTFYPNKENNNN